MNVVTTECHAHVQGVTLVFDSDPPPDLLKQKDYGSLVSLFDEYQRPVPFDVPAGFVEATRALTLQPRGELAGSRVTVRISQQMLRSKSDQVVRLLLPQDLQERSTRAVQDSVSYALLTEEIGGRATPGMPAGGGASANPLELVSQTLRDVLGWKLRDDDPKGFNGALDASFASSERDGVTTWRWKPRTYALQTDLAGGISGAQASLYHRAQEALSQSLPLLDGLYPLDPEADRENIDALKAVLRTQLNELVRELAMAGGPSRTRVEGYFNLLLATSPAHYEEGGRLVITEPDLLGGTLGQLRDQLGLTQQKNFVNTIEDEQDQTNFRILADYVGSLAQSWLNSRDFFGLGAAHPFLGTQLVPLSRQLSVIAESIDEVRFTLDSVFIGAAERQTIAIHFSPAVGEPMYAEDFFNWIQNFVTSEAPSYVQDGGKFGIGNSLLPIARQLQLLAADLLTQPTQHGLPAGFRSERVRRSLQSLKRELTALVDLAAPLKHEFIAEPAAAALQIATGRPDLIAVPRKLVFEGTSSGDDSEDVELLNLGNVDLTVSVLLVNPRGVPSFTFEGGETEHDDIDLESAGGTQELTLVSTDEAKDGDVGQLIFSYAGVLDGDPERTLTVDLRYDDQSLQVRPAAKP
ncbi:hypothetical protein [Rhizobacter sp. P5_C2]